jgi:hypothetical protein
VNREKRPAGALRITGAHLPQINERSFILSEVHLESDAIRAIDYGLHNAVNDAARRQADGNAGRRPCIVDPLAASSGLALRENV